MTIPPPNHSIRNRVRRSGVVVLLSVTFLYARGFQEKAAGRGTEYSGMYSFLHEGEFVQVTVEDEGRVTGFVSRYGDLESDKGQLLDHFFKSGRLDGNRLTFATNVVHGISFEFKGTIGRGAGKKPGDEAFYVIEGKLTETNSDEKGKSTSRQRGITLKSQPRSTGPKPVATPPTSKSSQ